MAIRVKVPEGEHEEGFGKIPTAKGNFPFAFVHSCPSKIAMPILVVLETYPDMCTWRWPGPDAGRAKGSRSHPYLVASPPDMDASHDEEEQQDVACSQEPNDTRCSVVCCPIYQDTRPDFG